MNDVTVRRPIKWNYAADTNVGMVRQVNEDAIISNPQTCIWAVADGMGGHEVGDVASDMIVKALHGLGNKQSLNDIVNLVEDELINVNERLLEYAGIMFDDNKTVGSTVVVLIIRGRVGACLWVGDSRLYRYRNGQLLQLSCDHSQVEELVQQGAIKPEEAENHPNANVITRAIGVDKELYVDINVFSVQIGDTFLLCSDGLYNAVKQPKLIDCLHASCPSENVDTLIATALEHGASDNVSAIVVKGQVDRAVVRNKL